MGGERAALPDRRWLLLLPLLLGGALRLMVVFDCAGLYLPSADPQEGYYESGIALLYQGVLTPDTRGLYPQPWRGPLYPAFIAGVESLSRRPWTGAIYLAQAALGMLAIAAVFALGLRIHSPLAGFFAAIWMAADPEQVLAVARLDLHGFYALFLLGVAGAALLWAQRPTTARTALLGLLLAASFLCRTAHYLLPLLLVGACLAWQGLRRGLRQAAVLAGFTILFLSPYLLRNAFQFGKPFQMDTGYGAHSLLAAAGGIDDTATIGEVLELADRMEPGFTQRHPTWESQQRALPGLAWRKTLARPGASLAGFLRREVLFWGPLAAAVLLWLTGLAFNRSSRELQALSLTAGSLAGYAILAIQPHYGIAVRPVLSVLAGVGLACLTRLRPAAQPRAGARSLGAFLGMLVLIYAVLLFFLAREGFSYGWPSDRSSLDAVAAHPDPRLTSVLERGAAVSNRAVASNWSTELDAAAGKKARSQAYLRRARLFLEGGLGWRAEADLRAALRLEPALEAARLLLAARLQQRERPEEVLALLQVPDGRGPSQTQAARRVALALAQRALGLSGARQELAEVLRAQPAAACRQLAATEGLFASPRQCRALALTPKALVDRGVGLYLKGDRDSAVATFQEALALAPDGLEAALSLATVLSEEGREQEALSTLDAVLAAGAQEQSRIRSDALALRQRLISRPRREGR